MKSDVLQFRLELAHELVGGFSSRKVAGRPRSMEHERLNSSLGHWPVMFIRNLTVLCVLQLYRRNSYHAMSHGFSVPNIKFTCV